MILVDMFIEDSKNKFLNYLVKLPKQYEWYLGLVIKIEDFDEGRKEPVDNFIKNKCNLIFEKSEQRLQLLKVTLIDGYTLLIFGTKPIPYSSNIKGIINSICKYLECETIPIAYVKRLQEMIFDSWGEQKYCYIINDNVAYNLKSIKEG